MSTTSFPTLIRTARSGSVFFRVTGLIRAGNLKWEDRPIWYDAYAAHPPFNEPVWHIQMPKRAEPVPKIFYPEDVERAKEMFERMGEQPKHNLEEPIKLD